MGRDFATSAAWPNWCGGNLPYCNRWDLYSSAPRLQCEDAPHRPKFLLDHGVPMLVSEMGYNCLHEAAWTGTCTENLRHVFESGAADATGISILKPHTGWPDNISLLYWAAASRNGAEPDKAFVAIWCRPRSEIQGKWRARKHRPAGGRCPRWLRMDSREAPDGARTDRVGRALRRALRLCLGRPSIVCANVQQT